MDEILSPLFKKEERLFQSLTKAILVPLSKHKPISLLLFGSQIDEKRARPDSDFDILCIIPDKINLKKFKNDLSQSEDLVEKRFGNRLSMLIMKKTDFLKRRKEKDSLILEIEEQNRLLFGKHIREIK